MPRSTKSEAVVNMHEAKSRLSELVARALRGETITIARDGEPVVRLVACKATPGKRKLGVWKGRVRMAADFDAPLPEDELACWSADT